MVAVSGLAMACQGIGEQTFNHEASFEASLIEEIEIHKENETHYCRQALARENPLEPHGNSCFFLWM